MENSVTGYEPEDAGDGSRHRGKTVMPRAPMCPFYGRTSHEDLVCLTGGAGTAGRHEMTMRFPTQVCRLRYWMDFCCQDWEKCSMAAALWREYERLEAKKKAGDASEAVEAAKAAEAAEAAEKEEAPPKPEKKLRPTARRKKLAKKKAAEERRKAAAEKKAEAAEQPQAM